MFSRVFLFFGSLTVVGVLTSVGTAVGRRRFFFGIKFGDSATKFLSNESAVKWSSHTTLLQLNINAQTLIYHFSSCLSSVNTIYVSRTFCRIRN